MKELCLHLQLLICNPLTVINVNLTMDFSEEITPLWVSFAFDWRAFVRH